MTVQRPIYVTPGSLFFEPGLPIHVNRVSESFRLQEHKHDFIEICIVAEGEGEHYIDGTHFKVTKGDLFYIPVGVSHVFRPRSASPDRRLIVYNCVFASACLDDVFRMLPLERKLRDFFRGAEEEGRWIALRDSAGEAQWTLQRLFLDSSQPAEGHSARLYAGLIELLVFVYRRCRPVASAPVPTEEDGVNELLGRIVRDCSSTLRAEDIAGELGVSVRQLQRLVKSASGMSLTEFVQEARIRESCRLLDESANKIGAIAAAVGYQDLKFFNRLFKRKTGMTPREYRRRAFVRDDDSVV
ncbi:helix-turn-helix transcriptional regulator [Cohnella cellulosilytica]|uniref:Helix-turn-helix domain-containing protein n=1 Tax=Cohnella cellulosilytica TaxID=986710 RepID=A0ABW2FGR3_9BACL